MALNANGGTITYSIKVDSSGAIVGIKNAESKMTAAAKSAGDKSGNALNKSFSAATVALGNIVSNVVSGVANKIGQSISGAIARVDTFNKFPKVLSNFGISADEASASIKRIDESLKGLPISLNAGVAGVQDLFFATKDLGQAENIFKAITDSALIFTTDATNATSNFIYAYKQAMAAGKVSAQDFNQMNSAIPGLMDKIAESMGMNVQTMKNGLSDGTVSVEQFNQAFLKLDSEGGAGMSSMATVAKDSVSGIQTAINLMNTTIQRVIGNIIDKVGSANIEKAFNTLGDIIEGVGSVIINIVTFLSQNEWVFWAIVTVLSAITAVMIAYGIATTVAAIATTTLTWPILLVIAAIAALITIVILIVTHLKELGEFFGMIFGEIGKFFGMIGQWVSDALNVLLSIVGWIWDNILSPIIEFISGFITTVWNIISGIIIAIIAILATIAQWIWDNVLSPVINFFVGLWNTIVGIVTNIWNGIVAILTPIGQWINDNIITPIVTFITGLWESITNIVNGIWTTIVSVFVGVASWIYNNVIAPIGNFFNSLWNGIKSGVEAVGNVIGNIFGTVVGVIKGVINGIIGGINAVINLINGITVPDWVPGIGGAHANIPNIPTLATGGIVESTVGGRVIVAGEGGEDEWVVPESKMASLIDKLNNSVNREPNVTIYVDGVFATSPEERRKVADDIMTAYNQNQRRRLA